MPVPAKWLHNQIAIQKQYAAYANPLVGRLISKAMTAHQNEPTERQPVAGPHDSRRGGNLRQAAIIDEPHDAPDDERRGDCAENGRGNVRCGCHTGIVPSFRLPLCGPPVIHVGRSRIEANVRTATPVIAAG